MESVIKDDGLPHDPKTLGKKTYVRPEVTKHTAASVAVGSGGCGYYVSEYCGSPGTYYY